MLFRPSLSIQIPPTSTPISTVWLPLDIASIEAANGNGTIDGTALTDIDGTAAAVVQAIADLDSDPTDFDSNGVAAAPDIASIEAANGNGTIDGTALTDIDGTAAAVVQLSPISIRSHRLRLRSHRAAAASTSLPSGSQRQRHHDGTALTDIDGTAAAVAQAITISIQIPPTRLRSQRCCSATELSIEAANGNGTIDGTALTDIDGTTAEITKLSPTWIQIH